jgi:hypothetical protein
MVAEGVLIQVEKATSPNEFETWKDMEIQLP